jgi:hypothetical protein
MVSSGVLGRVALIRTDVWEEISASFIRVTRIGELGTMLAVTSNGRSEDIPSYTAQLLRYPQDAQWTQFDTHYISEAMVKLGIESGTSGSVARNSDHYDYGGGRVL